MSVHGPSRPKFIWHPRRTAAYSGPDAAAIPVRSAPEPLQVPPIACGPTTTSVPLAAARPRYRVAELRRALSPPRDPPLNGRASSRCLVRADASPVNDPVVVNRKTEGTVGPLFVWDELLVRFTLDEMMALKPDGSTAWSVQRNVLRSQYLQSDECMVTAERLVVVSRDGYAAVDRAGHTRWQTSVPFTLAASRTCGTTVYGTDGRSLALVDVESGQLTLAPLEDRGVDSVGIISASSSGCVIALNPSEGDEGAGKTKLLFISRAGQIEKTVILAERVRPEAGIYDPLHQRFIFGGTEGPKDGFARVAGTLWSFDAKGEVVWQRPAAWTYNAADANNDFAVDGRGAVYYFEIQDNDIEHKALVKIDSAGKRLWTLKRSDFNEPYEQGSHYWNPRITLSRDRLFISIHVGYAFPRYMHAASLDGRPLWALHIGDPSTNMLVIGPDGTIHGDEFEVRSR